MLLGTDVPVFEDKTDSRLALRLKYTMYFRQN